MKLLQPYRDLHAQGKFPGMSLLLFAPEIAELVGAFKSKSLLDYGCGLGNQYHRERVHVLWGVEKPTLYDPAVSGIDIKPHGTFDGVISTDVLEHVPEDELPAFASAIAAYARQWVFLSVCCRPSKHIRFEDGSNVHVTIRPMTWWQDYLGPYFTGVRLVLKETP